MKHSTRIGALAGAFLGLLLLGSGTAFSSPNETTVSPNPDRGMYVFQAYCVGCHGESGQGNGPMAGKLFRDFAIRPTDLASVSFQDSHSDQQLTEAIRGGGKAAHRTPFMPAWGGTLTQRQVSDLVAFVRELKPQPTEQSATMVPVGEQLELGRVLYTVRCLACHGPEGRGNGPLIEGLTMGGSTLAVLPDFSKYEFFHHRSDADFEKVLDIGISHSGLLPETEPGWWDRALEPEETRALLLYLRSLPLQPAKGKS